MNRIISGLIILLTLYCRFRKSFFTWQKPPQIAFIKKTIETDILYNTLAVNWRTVISILRSRSKGAPNPYHGTPEKEGTKSDEFINIDYNPELEISMSPRKRKSEEESSSKISELTNLSESEFGLKTNSTKFQSPYQFQAANQFQATNPNLNNLFFSGLNSISNFDANSFMQDMDSQSSSSKKINFGSNINFLNNIIQSTSQVSTNNFLANQNTINQSSTNQTTINQSITNQPSLPLPISNSLTPVVNSVLSTIHHPPETELKNDSDHSESQILDIL